MGYTSIIVTTVTIILVLVPLRELGDLARIPPFPILVFSAHIKEHPLYCARLSLDGGLDYRWL